MIGKTLKHYKIEEELGKGGMGVVFRAQDTRLNRAVALKVLPPELMNDDDRRRRFVQEARTAGSLSHPAIAQIYDVDETDGVTFIAMELVEGKTVRQLVADRELDVEGAIEIAVQVAGGLAKAHEQGIVHRDIKSENIMVTRDGHAKILDFGLAKLTDMTGAQDESGQQRKSVMETLAMTQDGMVLGTMAYMSPEQARGQKLDHRSDIFSFGIVFYEMVTGQLPFTGASPLDTLHAIAFDETRPVTAIRTNLPGGLHRVISSCLRKKVDDRYQSATALVDDLKRLQQEIDSGIAWRAPLRERLQESLRSIKDLTPGEWFWPAIGIGSAATVLIAAFYWWESWLPFAFFFVPVGFICYRRLKSRRQRLIRRFAAKVKKLTEVRVIVFREDQATVVVDKAMARTYVRINALMETVNRKKYFGNECTVVVRDGVAPEEEREILATPGVLYVRRDILEAEE